MLDAFKSDSKEPSHLNLTLNSLIIRRLDFGYEEYYKPQTPGRLNASHLRVNRLNANISLKTLTQDSINLRVRSLDFKEQSGLDVQSFSFRLAANKRHMAVTQFELRLPHSQFTEDELQADYDLTKPGVFLKTVTLHGQIEQARISLNDLSCFVPVFKKTPYALNLSAKFDIKPEAVKINTIRLEEENKRMSMQAHAFMQRKKASSTGSTEALTSCIWKANLPPTSFRHSAARRKPTLPNASAPSTSRPTDFSRATASNGSMPMRHRPLATSMPRSIGAAKPTWRKFHPLDCKSPTFSVRAIYQRMSRFTPTCMPRPKRSSSQVFRPQPWSTMLNTRDMPIKASV